MSLLAELKVLRGATHKEKRRGRGNSSGLGGTAGHGHKGQKARSGGKVRRGFEGGQMPLHRRLPKFGFKNLFRVSYEVVNLASLEKLSGEVTPEILKREGLTGSGRVKILAKGKLTKALKVTAHAFSKSARAAIEAAGGSVEVLK